MPLVRISIHAGRSSDFKATIGDCIHQAMVSEMKVPEHDRFQLITDHNLDDIIYDKDYLSIHRTEGIVIIQITLNAGRALEVKKAFYAKTAASLKERLGIRPEDVFINLVEVPQENWSFGNGEAQYAPK